MKRYGKKGELILGVSASTRRVHGVLMQDSEEGPVILRHFIRERSGLEPFAVAGLGAVQEESAPDVSLKIGETGGSGGEGMFLAGEFGGVSGDDDSGDAGSIPGEQHAPARMALPFDQEMEEILIECENAGYEKPRLVFSLTSEHVGTVSFDALADSEGKARKSKSGPGFDKLLEKARAKSREPIQEGKVAFLPMRHGNPGDPTHVAVFAHAGEPVSPTIRTLRERHSSTPDVRLIDTEVTLLYGLARAARLRDTTALDEEVEAGDDDFQDSSSVDGRRPDRQPTTLVVRAGVEDTLVMFIEGDELVHFENLRSIAAYDPAETICSRVLLLQDEFGRGDADHILLFGADREKRLLQSFEEFFELSNVTSIRSLLPETEEDLEETVGREGILAAAAALRLVDDELYQSVFEDVDFLDKKLRGPRIRLPFSWSVAAMITLLFATSLFFTYRYFSLDHDLEMYRYELKHYPEDVVQANTKTLQARLDSLQAQSAGLMHSLDVLDSLLVGSDQWSRTLESTAEYAQEIQGLWIESMYPNEGKLILEGNATDRKQVVAFASYSGAVIETIKFSQIRDWPVYTFTMKVPITRELPEAARYLRDRALDALKASNNSEDPEQTAHLDSALQTGDTASRTDAAVTDPAS